MHYLNFYITLLFPQRPLLSSCLACNRKPPIERKLLSLNFYEFKCDRKYVILKIFIVGSSISLFLFKFAAYLTKGNYNVWMVDWRVVAAGPFFPLVIASLNHVGACVAEFVQNLRNVTSASSLESLHVIGFSLGAHVAAFAARHLKPYKLPRITGTVLLFSYKKDNLKFIT